MVLRKDYKKIIMRHVKEGYFNAFYNDALSKYKAKNRFLFCESLQKLIVKIGRIISSAAITPTSNESNSIGNLNYLCNYILKDSCLYYEFLATNFNQEGNNAKHILSMNENNIQIEKIAGLFNRMVNQLCKRINDDTLMTYKFIQCNNKKVEKKAVAKSTKKKDISKSSQVSNENVILNASFLNDEGIAYRTNIFSKKKVILFGVNIKCKSIYPIKKIEVLLSTRRGTKLYKAHIGDNHYEVDAYDVKDNKVSIKVKVEYTIKSNVISYKEVCLTRSYK